MTFFKHVIYFWTDLECSHLKSIGLAALIQLEWSYDVDRKSMCFDFDFDFGLALGEAGGSI